MWMWTFHNECRYVTVIIIIYLFTFSSSNFPSPGCTANSSVAGNEIAQVLMANGKVFAHLFYSMTLMGCPSTIHPSVHPFTSSTVYATISLAHDNGRYYIYVRMWEVFTCNGIYNMLSVESVDDDQRKKHDHSSLLVSMVCYHPFYFHRRTNRGKIIHRELRRCKHKQPINSPFFLN